MSCCLTAAETSQNVKSSADVMLKAINEVVFELMLFMVERDVEINSSFYNIIWLGERKFAFEIHFQSYIRALEYFGH